ncbi:uncharacterized protein B0T23DRAFT_184739 [Neurospora hispaniola]|uniref:C2H2-type domain-containing protein n=1 Tax=Neurospora hispaniola TaxID=588809 RepID=A0AAJ0I303_9PEZI|nr:hypothetical protein B0T23DRAFT_184739 [Neurospora hispaniola]
MASEKGHLAATETPLATPATSQLAAASSAPEAPPTATSDAAFALAAEISRAKSLKRSREETPPSPDSVESSSPGDLSPSKIARLVGFARSPPPSLNGTADHDEERRRRDEEHHVESVAASENLTHSPLADLMSGAPSGLARPPDAPSVPPLSSLDAAADAAARALSAVTIPAPTAVTNELKGVNQPSAPSAPSLANASGEVVNSPVPMDVDSREDQRLYASQPDAQMEPQDKPPSSLSYPGVLPHGTPMSAPAPPSRGMSMPIPNAQGADVTPRSPGSKKHKCPYCSTEFTRHHNLKSHLLTHSQEKPYVCSTCQMRFRRLHDLKRHSKLHTGEKPHICPKCDRKFARGDALARHSKGAGGCAGRRPSMGNFGDEDYDSVNPTGADESGLSNVMYEGAAEGELAAAEEERRRLSLPAIKAQHVPGQQTAPDGYAAHSSTYPPAGPRPGGLYPPNVDRGSTGPPTSPSVPNNHTPHTSISSIPLSSGGTTMYSQTGMTESPKPLSPGTAQPTALSHDALTRQRAAPQQPHFRPAEQAPASGLSLPSHGMSPAAEQAWLSQYPPADRDPSQGNTSAPASPATQQTAARGRNRASGGPPGPNRPGMVDGNNLFAAGEQGVWSYVQHMEDKFKHLQSMVEATSQTNTELTAKLNSHEQHISVLNQNSAELVAKINTYEQHISSLNQTLTNLTAKCTNHEQHISVLTAEVTALRQQQQHQHQQQHQLHHQLEHHRQENQEANLQEHLPQHQQEHQQGHQQQHQSEHQPEHQPEPQSEHQPGHQPEHQQQHHQPEHQQQHVPTETQEPPPAAQQ